jgi:ribonuclease P protein component
MPTQTLSKNERLKSYKRIRILFAEGEKFRVSPLLVYFRVDSKVEGVEEVEGGASSHLQMGVSVSSRHFKRAVDRNLLKRRIREAYRTQKYELKKLLEEKGITMDIFFVYIEPEIRDYDNIHQSMTNALKSLTQKVISISQFPSPNS